jgi:hypothetical protein
MAACGPVDYCQPRTPEDFFGVWLNVERVRLQWAYAAARGGGLVHGSQAAIDWNYFDAEALVEAEADDMAAVVNEQRLRHKDATKLGFDLS